MTVFSTNDIGYDGRIRCAHCGALIEVEILESVEFGTFHTFVMYDRDSRMVGEDTINLW